MTRDNPDTLYCRRKKAVDLDSWSETEVPSHPATTFNFASHNFKLNGVVYRDDCIEFQDVISKLQLWKQLKEKVEVKTMFPNGGDWWV